MRVLMFASCAEGLVQPMVPLAWALRTAGHDVLVAAPANMEPVFVGAGLPVTAYTPAIDIPDVLRHDRHGNPITRPEITDEYGMLAHIGRGYGRLATRFYDPGVELAEKWKPDLVLSEPQGLAGALIARKLGVPWVKLGIGPGTPWEMEAAGIAELAPELEALGLDGFPEPDVFLDPCPPSLQRDDQPCTHRFRYLPYNGSAQLPPWYFREKERPRLCLTIGTRLPLVGDLPILDHLVRDLPDLGYELVVAVGEDQAAKFRPLPPHVVAIGRVPLNLALGTCDVAVHHGGTATTMACLVAGVPTVTFPVIAEVWDFARRLDRAGAAIRIGLADLNAENILAACAVMRDDPSFVTNAGQLAKEVASLPTLAETVDVLERLG